jgi:hypothetical protein
MTHELHAYMGVFRCRACAAVFDWLGAIAHAVANQFRART